MSRLLERLHHMDIDEHVRCELSDAIVALEIECALLRASLNAHRQERDRLLHQVSEALAMTRRITKATQ